VEKEKGFGVEGRDVVFRFLELDLDLVESCHVATSPGGGDEGNGEGEDEDFCQGGWETHRGQSQR
jgi:hypothetical protein